MSSSTEAYKKALRKHLTCGRGAKKRLMGRFEDSLFCYLEENPEPGMEDLTWAFGTPEKMAGNLMEDATAEETAQYRRWKIVKKIVAGVLIAAFLFFTFYVYFIKEIPLVTADWVVRETTNLTESTTAEGEK